MSANHSITIESDQRAVRYDSLTWGQLFTRENTKGVYMCRKGDGFLDLSTGIFISSSELVYPLVNGSRVVLTVNQ